MTARAALALVVAVISLAACDSADSGTDLLHVEDGIALDFASASVGFPEGTGGGCELWGRRHGPDERRPRGRRGLPLRGRLGRVWPRDLRRYPHRLRGGGALGGRAAHVRARRRGPRCGWCWRRTEPRAGTARPRASRARAPAVSPRWTASGPLRTCLGADHDGGAPPGGEAPPQRAPACTPDSVRARVSRARPVPPSIWGRRRRRPRAAYPRPRAGTLSGTSPGRTLCGLAPRGVCLAATVAGRAGGLLPHRFTHHLCPARAGPSAGLFSAALAVVPPKRDAFPLGSTVPCGVRTFLPGTGCQGGPPEAAARPTRLQETGGRRLLRRRPPEIV